MLREKGGKGKKGKRGKGGKEKVGKGRIEEGRKIAGNC